MAIFCIIHLILFYLFFLLFYFEISSGTNITFYIYIYLFNFRSFEFLRCCPALLHSLVYLCVMCLDLTKIN